MMGAPSNGEVLWMLAIACALVIGAWEIVCWLLAHITVSWP